MSEDKNSLNIFAVENKRVERRIQVNVAVEVTRFGSDGRPISEHTFIEDVSDFGCRFSTRGQAKQGDTVSVRLLGSGGKILPDEEPRLYQVIWVAPKGHGSTVGARLIKGDKLIDLNSQPDQGSEKRR